MGLFLTAHAVGLHFGESRNTSYVLRMGVENVKFVVKEEKIDESKAKIVLESIVDGKPDNTPMEFEYRKEGGKWKSAYISCNALI